MTKKAEREARIAADKRAAWSKKVQTLTGHVWVSQRIDRAEFDAAYAEGKTADEFATIIASREPVGLAVHPLKVGAVERAGQHAMKIVDGIRKELEENGWDANKVAPYPDSNMNRAAYAIKVQRYQEVARVTKSETGSSRRGQPRIVAMCDDRIARFVRAYEESAALQYDAFICKLVAKVGECDAARIEGSHVWGESTLTISKPTGTEKWRTHQIENVSKLGLYFPQWPTRLLKGGA